MKRFHLSIKLSSLLILLAGTYCIGLAPIFVRLSRSWGEIGPIGTAFWRVFIASLVLIPIVAYQYSSTRRRKESTIVTPKLFLLMFIPGVFFASDLSAWHWSIELTTVVNSTLLANLATIFVSLIGWLFLKERLNIRFPIGGATAFFGVLLLIYSVAQGDVGKNPIVGDSLGVLTACFYTGYILSIKLLRDRVSTLLLLAVSSLSASMVLLPLALYLEGGILPHSSTGWYPLLGLAFISHCAGQGMIALALRDVPATVASICLLNQPVAAALFAWIILGEAMNLGQFVGSGFFLVGLYIAIQGKENT